MVEALELIRHGLGVALMCGGVAISAAFLPRNVAACVAEQRSGQSAQPQIIPPAEKDVESQVD